MPKGIMNPEMRPAFDDISAVLSKREMDELGWQGFQGTVSEYRITRNRIVDENGNLREEFLGMRRIRCFCKDNTMKSRMLAGL